VSKKTDGRKGKFKKSVFFGEVEGILLISLISENPCQKKGWEEG
jgi:hypothetical protein